MSNEAKFTKGPWNVDQYGNIVQVKSGKSDPRDCIRAGGLALASNNGEPMANRYLIAAAPEMYAMLQDIANKWHDGTPLALKINKLLTKARGEIK